MGHFHAALHLIKTFSPMEETCPVWRTIGARFDDDGLLVMKWAFYYHSSGCSYRPALASQPQSVLAAHGWCPIVQTPIWPSHSFKHWLKNLLYLYVWVKWATVPTGNRNKRDGALECENMLPQGYPCTHFFLPHSLHSLALGLTQIVTDSLCATICS